MVQAIYVYTTGLGGDSHVRWGEDGELAIGPRRAVPLSMLGALHPQVTAELRRQVATAAEAHPVAEMGDFILAWRLPAGHLAGPDAEALQRFAGGPQSLLAILGGTRWRGPLRSRIRVWWRVACSAAPSPPATRCMYWAA